MRCSNVNMDISRCRVRSTRLCMCRVGLLVINSTSTYDAYDDNLSVDPKYVRLSEAKLCAFEVRFKAAETSYE